MKRFFVAITLIVIVVSVAVSINLSFERRIDTLCDGLNGLLELSKTADDETLMRATENFNTMWDENTVFIHTIVIHRIVDDAEQYVTGLSLLLEAGNRDEFEVSCIQALNKIESLARSEKFLPENILSFPTFIHK